MNTAGEQVIVLPGLGFIGPVAHRVTGRLGNLELNWPRGLLLHYGGSGRYVFAMADVAHSHFFQVTGPQFAVQSQIEHDEFTNAVLKLKADPNGPNLLQFEWRFLPGDHALVPVRVVTHSI